MHINFLYMCLYINLSFRSADNIPSSENINISCSSRVNRNKSYFHFDYDGTITLQFDDTFTPPIISRVHGFEAYAFEIYGNSSYKPGSTFDLRVLWPLETNVTQGPVTVDIPFHFLQLTNGRGYRIFVSIIIVIQRFKFVLI